MIFFPQTVMDDACRESRNDEFANANSRTQLMPSKLDRCGQACDLDMFLSIDICKHGVMPLQFQFNQR